MPDPNDKVVVPGADDPTPDPVDDPNPTPTDDPEPTDTPDPEPDPAEDYATDEREYFSQYKDILGEDVESAEDLVHKYAALKESLKSKQPVEREPKPDREEPPSVKTAEEIKGLFSDNMAQRYVDKLLETADGTAPEVANAYKRQAKMIDAVWNPVMKDLNTIFGNIAVRMQDMEWNSLPPAFRKLATRDQLNKVMRETPGIYTYEQAFNVHSYRNPDIRKKLEQNSFNEGVRTGQQKLKRMPLQKRSETVSKADPDLQIVANVAKQNNGDIPMKPLVAAFGGNPQRALAALKKYNAK